MFNWLNRLRNGDGSRQTDSLRRVQEKFATFRELLESHNSTLKQISRLVGQRRNDHTAELLSIWSDSVAIHSGVAKTVGRMIELGGEKYAVLNSKCETIWQEFEKSLPFNAPDSADVFILPLADTSKEDIFLVGTKNAYLGELKSRLNLPIPEGFAISTTAYRYFLEANNLQEQIRTCLKDVGIDSPQIIEETSRKVRETIVNQPVPEDLAGALFNAFDQLALLTGKDGFALRSSAVGEDTSYSFAGQYLTVLNVRRDVLLEQYKQIIASKFTPSAISYMLNRSLIEVDLGMGVVCMEMIDAAASGVVYSLDPMHPGSEQVVVNSIFGLGSYLEDGTVTPDLFHISRETKEIVRSVPGSKNVQLMFNELHQLESTQVSQQDQDRLSLNADCLVQLANVALEIEQHFGYPQDIEWAQDRSGKIVVLQARPLVISHTKAAPVISEEFRSLVLMEGATPVCPGIGIGKVYHLNSARNLELIPAGSILVATNPSPYLVAIMHKINGLITVSGGSASHLATLARELDLPTVVGLKKALELEEGSEITLDSSNGVIYSGSHVEWMTDPDATSAISQTISDQEAIDYKRLTAPIVHLNVIHPSDPRFTPENCHSFHDVLRYIHQKSMDEIFMLLQQTSDKEKIGLRLKTKIPIAINIIYLDRDPASDSHSRWIPELEIESRPMQALWSGVLTEGWPQTQIPVDLKGFMGVVGANLQEGHTEEFSENSYAFLSDEYMLLNLRMGYHFSTIEAIASSDRAKNYIRMQFKLGGAPLERRIRRIWLIGELLALMGFENSSQGDFLDSTIAYLSESEILARLKQLGRITVLTKQLDMALSSDARAQSYLNAFALKLNLTNIKG